LGIGGNDALRFLPVADTRQNIVSTIDILKSGIKPPVVVLLQMQAPLNAGLLYKQDFDSLYQEIAEKNYLVLIPFITNEIFINPENKLRDGIHYNQQGYQKVVEKYLLPTIEALIKDF
jgi:acyl-CoA thioesterase-1